MIPQRQIDMRRNISDVTLVIGALFWSLVLGFITTVSSLESLSREYSWLQVRHIHLHTHIYMHTSCLSVCLRLSASVCLPVCLSVSIYTSPTTNPTYSIQSSRSWYTYIHAYIHTFDCRRTVVPVCISSSTPILPLRCCWRCWHFYP